LFTTEIEHQEEKCQRDLNLQILTRHTLDVSCFHINYATSFYTIIKQPQIMEKGETTCNRNSRPAVKMVLTMATWVV